MLPQLIAASLSAPSSDVVASLPSYGTPPTPQWSGYLDAGNGTNLHYYLASAEGPAPFASKPLVLWLNGGPGSSSLLGMMQELGPLLMNATGGLMENPYAWTKLANVVALESPAGVGFSYCTKNGAATNECANTDKTTAADARRALVDFFSKFPELVSAPFFITGESYGGVYVPTLAKEVLDHTTINLHGVYVGDPCTDNAAQKDSMDMLWYGHKYGFVPEADFDLLWNKCGRRHAHPLSAGEWRGRAPVRRAASSSSSSPACDAAYRRFLASTSRGFSQGWSHAYINDVSLYGYSALVSWDAVGSENWHQKQYLQRDDVKAALHVEASPATAWPGPPDGWKYTSSYDACNAAAAPGSPSMVDFYREIAPKLRKTVVFNGDTDPCVSYEGTRTAIERVGFNVTNAYRPWFFNATAATVETLTEKDVLFGPSLTTEPAGPQLGGHIVDYEHGLSFATVHGSGHMAPQFRPRSSLVLIKHIVQNTSFAPDLPSDAELAAMEEDAFSSFLDEWTLSAQTTEFIAD